MELHYYLLLSWVIGSYAIYSYVAAYRQRRHDEAQARKLGCKPAPKLSNAYPFGLEHIKQAIMADRNKRFPDFILEWYKTMDNRTHQHTTLGMTSFMTANPKNIQAILATQFKDFGIGDLRRKNFLPMFGNGIFTTDGKMWEHSRAMMRPQFAREQVSDLELEEEHLQNMMLALPTNGAGWTPEVDLQVLFFRLTLDSACEFLFGESTNSQIDNLPQRAGSPPIRRPVHALQEKNFASAFDNGQSWLALRTRVFHLYWLMDSFEFRRNIKDVHSFVDHFVARALRQNHQPFQTEKGDNTQSSHLNQKKGRYVFLDSLAAQTRNPVELRSQLLNILLAGRDTTASFLGWIFYNLARRPDIFQKLRATIIRDFGTYSACNPKTDISFSKLKNCTYMQHVLNETLRLYPVVPVNQRRAVVDTTLPRGGGEDGESPIFVKKGQGVDYSVHVMHRLKQYWGDDADEFRPERWVGRKPGWEYLPFNGGPRICLGQQFALTEASYVTVRLLQRFDGIVNCDPATETTHGLTLTSCPGNGVKVRLHAAKI